MMILLVFVTKHGAHGQKLHAANAASKLGVLQSVLSQSAASGKPFRARLTLEMLDIGVVHAYTQLKDVDIYILCCSQIETGYRNRSRG